MISGLGERERVSLNWLLAHFFNAAEGTSTRVICS